jgi:hypothetical protein
LACHEYKGGPLVFYYRRAIHKAPDKIGRVTFIINISGDMAFRQGLIIYAKGRTQKKDEAEE